MPDPEELLKGSVKLMRWIPMENAAAINRPAVVTQIDSAFARNPIPFAKIGDGPVVIQSIRAK